MTLRQLDSHIGAFIAGGACVFLGLRKLGQRYEAKAAKFQSEVDQLLAVTMPPEQIFAMMRSMFEPSTMASGPRRTAMEMPALEGAVWCEGCQAYHADDEDDDPVLH